MKIFFSDLTKLPINYIDVEDGTLDLTVTLALIGDGAWFSYGDDINSNFLRLLERSTSPTPPQSPTEGEIWYNPNTGTHYVARVSIPFREEIPADPPSIPFPLPAQDEVLEWHGVGEPVFADTPPLSMDTLWFDTDEEQLKVNINGTWTSVADRYLPLSGGTMTGDWYIEGTSAFNNVSASDTAVDRQLNIGDITLMETLFSPTVQAISGLGKIKPNFTTVIAPDTYNADIFASALDLQLSSDTSVTLSIGGSSTLEITTGSVKTKTPIDFNTNVITNVAVSANVNAAVTRGEVDDTVSGFENDLVNRVGDIMSGTLVTPSVYFESDSDSFFDTVIFDNGFKISANSTSLYLGDDVNQAIRLYGPTAAIAATLEAPYDTIKNVADPSLNTHGVNKDYVDGLQNTYSTTISSQLVPESGARAWVNFRGDGAGNIIVSDSYNIDSLTKTGTGVYQMVLSDSPASVDSIVPIISFVQNDLSTGGILKHRQIQTIIDGFTDTGATATMDFRILRRRLQSVYAGFGDTSLTTRAYSAVGDLGSGEELMIIFYW